MDLKNVRTPTLIAVCLLTFTGCGDTHPGSAPARQQSSGTPQQSSSLRTWDETEVLKLAGIETIDDGLAYRLKAHPECHAAVIMVSRNMVDTYADAGDNVAVNLDRTAGVKVVSAQQATCTRRFAEALQAVK